MSAGGGKVMAEPAARHLSLPSGLLELCALLGASQDSLRGLEQVRGERGTRVGVGDREVPARFEWGWLQRLLTPEAPKP